MLGALARRAGKWPHEVLALTPEQLALALQCWDAERAYTARHAPDSGFQAVSTLTP